MDTTFFIGIIGAAFGFLASYLLAFKTIKSRDILDIMLFILTFSLSWILLTTSFIQSGVIYFFPHLFRTAVPMGCLLGPACYLYVRVFLKKGEKNSSYHYIHFLPALLVTVDITPFLLKTAAEKKEILEAYLIQSQAALSWNEGVFFSSWLLLLVSIYTLVYLGISAKLILSSNKSVKFSNINHVINSSIRWLLSLISCISIVALTYLWTVLSKSEYSYAYTIFELVLCIILLAFTFLLFHNPEILYGLSHPQNSNNSRTRKKYIPFDENQLEIYVEQLNQFMQDSQRFLANGYSLDEMSKDTNIGRHHLSIVINKGLGMKYNELINRYRIEYLIHHYQKVNNKNLTIEGIASEVGFNSRTTFLHSVKRFTGLTPTEFISRLENKDTLLIRTEV